MSRREYIGEIEEHNIMFRRCVVVVYHYHNKNTNFTGASVTKKEHKSLSRSMRGVGPREQFSSFILSSEVLSYRPEHRSPPAIFHN